MNIKRIVQWPRNHLLVVICLSASVVLVAAAVYRHAELVSVNARLQLAQDRVEKIHRNSRFSTTIDDDLKKLDDYQLRIAKVLMDPSAKASNLAYFYGAGSRCGVTLVRVEQRIPAAAAQAKVPEGKEVKPELAAYSTLQFAIGAEGEFASIVRYLDTLRAERFLMRIDKLSIEPATAAAQTGRIESVDIVLTVLTDLQTQTK